MDDRSDPVSAESSACETSTVASSTGASTSLSRRLAIGLWMVVVVAIAAGVWSWSSQGIVFQFLRTDLDAHDKVERLKEFFDSCGVWAPAVYVVLVTAEVVIAPIPGLMLYAPGGLVFGPILGGLLALIGNVLGSGIACVLARTLGADRLSRHFAVKTNSKLRSTLESRGSWLIFWLRLNPLTSSDLVSYAAGFTPIRTWKVMFATGCGMAPLCFAQSALSDTVFNAFPQVIYPLIGLCIAYVAVTIFVLMRSRGATAERATENP